ncbi:MAG: sigma-70 family RNA polymerase sigma factor [Actinomycetota bacterium]
MSGVQQSVPTWEEVAEQHGRFLYNLAYRLCGNHQDAQDLVQEVLLRVRRGLRNYKPGNLEGWLSRITTNTFLDRVRKQKRRPTVPLPDDPDRVIAGSPDVDAELAARGLPDDLQQLLGELPPDYRAAVVLADVIGYSYEEIAGILDVPIGTVRSRIHRGRGRLRAALAS